MRYITNKIIKIGYNALAMLLIALVLVSPASLLVYAQTTTQAPSSEKPCQNLYVKALALYNILNSSLSLNLSTDLRNSITNLLKTNVSSLDCSGLKDWVDQASRYLASIENQVREGRAYAVGLVEQRYLNGLKTAIENRLRILGKELNISVEDVIANVSSAKDINEIMRALEKVRVVEESKQAERFARVIIEVSIKEASKSAKDLDKSIKDLNKTSEILGSVLENLIRSNASEEAIKALREAQEKINEARNILENVSKRVSVEGEEKLKQVYNETLKKYYEEIYNELVDMRQELLEMKQFFASINQTNATALINELLDRVESMLSSIRNASPEDLARWMPDLLEIKIKIESLRKLLEEHTKEIIKTIPTVASYKKLLNETKRMLEEVINMTNTINSVYKEICVGASSPPTQCEILNRTVQYMLSYANSSIERAKELIKMSEELYANNETVKALLTLVSARAILEDTRAKLEPVYEALIKLSKQSKEKETSTKTVVAKVSVEGELRQVKGSVYKLVLVIRNEGSAPVTIDKVILLLTPAIEIQVNITIEPGKEASFVRENIVLSPTQVAMLKSVDRINVIIILGSGQVASGTLRVVSEQTTTTTPRA